MFNMQLATIIFATWVCLIMSTIANAHLMVARNGTLNYLDGNVYMVLSLPISAFAADDDKDGLLSLTEFAQHREELIDDIKNSVTLSNKNGELQMHGIMVSPVTPHDAPKTPAEQVIVMGRFSVGQSADPLYFEVDLFGQEAPDQRLKVTATHKSANVKQVFELTPAASKAKLAL